MIRSNGARAALCAVLAFALAGCVENAYRDRGNNVVVVNEEPQRAEPASGTARPAVPGSSSAGDAPAVTAAAKRRAQAEGYTLDGFRVYADDERLWVFKAGSDDLKSYLEKGEPAKRVTLIGQGPNGITLMGSDSAVMKSYADAARYSVPGFVVQGHEGRLWVFKRGSAAYKSFREKGEPAKRVTLVGAGPNGTTLMGADKHVLQDFAASHRFAAPGFVTASDDGRLWVFRQGSPHLASFVMKGEPAKRVTLIGSGPEGKTLLGADKEAMEAYAKAVAN